jgi:hypothetical protein
MSYLRAFKKIGFDRIMFFDLDRARLLKPSRQIWKRAIARGTALLEPFVLSRALLEFLRERAFDFIFVFKGYDISRKTLEACRELQPGAIWAILNPDDPFNLDRAASNSRIRASIDFFDIYFIWSRALCEKLVASGCRRVEYLPFAHDPELHEPVMNIVEEPLASFAGSWDPMRESILSGLADFNIKIFGNGWDSVRNSAELGRAIASTSPIIGQDLANIIARSAVCLNILRPQNYGSHNMRTFEIPGMGGLMLTTRSQEQEEFFPDGDGCLMYSEFDELRFQMERALADQRLRKRIKKAAFALATNHSYAERARSVARMVGLDR